MLLVIGQNDCTACKLAVNLLTKRNIEFEYILFDSLSSEEQQYYINLAEQHNQLSYPLIIKDNSLITLQEV